MRHLIIAITLAGCGLLNGGNTPPDGKVTWPEIARCGPDVPDLVASVSRVLQDGIGPELGGRARGELEDLAIQHGPRTVICLVDLLVREWASPGATQTPRRMEATARARDFLDETGTRVEHAE